VGGRANEYKTIQIRKDALPEPMNIVVESAATQPAVQP
jgi:hypothetical protein